MNSLGLAGILLYCVVILLVSSPFGCTDWYTKAAACSRYFGCLSGILVFIAINPLVVLTFGVLCIFKDEGNGSQEWLMCTQTSGFFLMTIGVLWTVVVGISIGYHCLNAGNM